MTAIVAMQLTWQDLAGWAQAQGLSMGLSPEVLATRQAQGWGRGGFGPAGNLSEEEREAMRTTAEASGTSFGGRGFGGRRGQLTILAEPLIELLTQRAEEWAGGDG